MAIKHFPVVRFTSRGREYEVDERLITTIDKHRSEKDAHHIYLTDGTYFCATNVVRVNLSDRYRSHADDHSGLYRRQSGV